jgi:hypothetical protein
MAGTLLKHIRLISDKELKDRILLGLKENDDSPVVHRWKQLDFVIVFMYLS